MAYLLMVEDDEDFAKAVATHLEKVGHEVKIELEFENGIASMEERIPDLVLLDVMFPEDVSGGFKFSSSMQKEYEKFKDIPVLMMSAIDAKFPMAFSSKDMQDSWLPISDFVKKPVDLDVIEAKVNELLSKAR